MSVSRLVPGPVLLADGRTADYVDVFAVTGLTSSLRPRDAAESMLAGGLFARVVWRGALGLHVEPGRTDTVAGWTVAADAASLLDLVVGGRRMSGRMLFAATPTGLTWTTALRYGGPLAAPTWRALGPVHRALVPRLLGRLSSVRPGG